jgi:hypothetical protein
MAKPDLNKLKSEIDNRKKERGIVAEQVQGTALLPKDVFLNELMKSVQTGQETKATNLIKVVENKTAARFGEVARHDVQPIAPVPQRPITPIQNLNEVGMSPERDELLFAEFEKRRKQTLAESIEGFNKSNGAPVIPTYNNIPPVTPGYGQPAVAGVPMLNEQYLGESVKRIVNNYLIENFGPVVEEAIKSTILEMYAVERIKEVLTENKDMIKTIVAETLKEIIAKNKAAKGQ